METKKVYIYGSSTFITGLKLCLENTDKFSVHSFINLAGKLSELKEDDSVLIIEKDKLRDLSREIIEESKGNNGELVEVLLKFLGLKIICLDADNEEVYLIRNNKSDIKNIDDLIKHISEKF